MVLEVERRLTADTLSILRTIARFQLVPSHLHWWSDLYKGHPIDRKRLSVVRRACSYGRLQSMAIDQVSPVDCNQGGLTARLIKQPGPASWTCRLSARLSCFARDQ